jgi:flagellar biosynthetic protein FliQ
LESIDIRIGEELQMTEQDVVTLIRNSLWIIIKVSSPILLSALIVGLVVGILQTTTSIQEPTIAFVPKLLAIFVVIVVFSSWMIRSLVDYTRELFFIIERL